MKAQSNVAIVDYQRISGLQIKEFCQLIGRSTEWFHRIQKGKPRAEVNTQVIGALAECGANPVYFVDERAPQWREGISPADFKLLAQKKLAYTEKATA